MRKKKKIMAINGSASQNSSNLALIRQISEQISSEFDLTLFDRLTELPHFRTALTEQNVPAAVLQFRKEVANADGILICSPEYVFSIPSGLKNALEWCVSTTVFSEKPLGIITASAHGVKGHEELQLIMKTLGTSFTKDTTLLVQGVKGKINEEGKLSDVQTNRDLTRFITSFQKLVAQASTTSTSQ